MGCGQRDVNSICCLLPFESLDHVTNPAGLRMGVQEMTRVVMKEFRAPFQAVKYPLDG